MRSLPDLEGHSNPSFQYLLPPGRGAQGEALLAAKAARIAEEVHPTLVKRIGWAPAERTHLVLIDPVDASSGSATPFPNNTSYISLTAPPENVLPFPLRFDDWLRQVIVHEYVHILHLDMNRGFTASIREILGRHPLPVFVFNGAFPNLLQPAWLIEGLATYEETASGVSDRRDGAYTQMVLRMAILEDRFPSVEQAGGFETWPGNPIQYLFGAAFYTYLAERFGEDMLREIRRNYSDNPLPFFVETNAEQ